MLIIELIKLLLLKQKLKILKDKINRLIKVNNKLIKDNSALLIQVNTLKKPFDKRTGDLTWSAYKLLNESS